VLWRCQSLLHWQRTRRGRSESASGVSARALPPPAPALSTPPPRAPGRPQAPAAVAPLPPNPNPPLTPLRAPRSGGGFLIPFMLGVLNMLYIELGILKHHDPVAGTSTGSISAA
jgi:hypothetical protein